MIQTNHIAKFVAKNINFIVQISIECGDFEENIPLLVKHYVSGLNKEENDLHDVYKINPLLFCKELLNFILIVLNAKGCSGIIAEKLLSDCFSTSNLIEFKDDCRELVLKILDH